MAIGLLARDGYGALTTMNVQRAADVSRGRLLHAFASRRELVLAAAGKLGDELEELILQGTADAADLREVAANWWTAARGPVAAAAFELWHGIRNDPECRGHADRFTRKLSIERLAAAAASQTNLDVGDLAVTLHLIRSLVLGERDRPGTLPAPLERWIAAATACSAQQK